MHGQPKYPAGFERFEYTSSKAVKGGALKIAGTGSFDSLNQFISKGVAEPNLGLIYDSLMVGSADEPSTLYGLVAQSIEYPKDRSEITFNLNPNAIFSDGKKITASDVEFTFKKLTTEGDPQYKLYFADVEKITVLSENAVNFKLKHNRNQELIMSIATLPILPKHYWQGREFNKTTLEIPVGSGPYTIERLDAGRQVTYLRNANYWAQDINVNKGLYNFNRVIVDYYRDLDVALEAFKSGAYDYQYELMSKAWATAYDVPAVKNGDIQKIMLPDDNIQGMLGILFNTRKPPLNDAALREAMSLAFDFEWTNKNMFYGLYARSDSFFENSELEATGTPSKEELALLTPLKDQLPPTTFGEKYAVAVTDGSGNNRTSLGRAKQLLDKAGYTIKNNQLIDPKTQKAVEFEYLERQQGFERVISPWLANLKKLGISVNFRMLDQAQWITRLQDYDFDMLALSYPPTLSPGAEQALYWGSESAKTPMSSNYIGIQNPAIDSLITHVVEAKNREAQIIAARALDRALINNHYLVPLYHNRSHRIAYWNKFERPETTTHYDFRQRVGMYTWWYSKEKDQALKKAQKQK
ncbi:MAG: extracellular solute-binding protein [Marinagarivorans sp.]|nr:extracellular solute-binding protein [Marinagarivorans sp.]